jgi:hypothetical protein
MKAFLLIGQSNMAGRGDFGQVPEIVNGKCFMLRNGRWQPMSEPINPDRAVFAYFHSGVGLSASFADEYAKRFDEEIGLIPCADGGTSLAQWMPGETLFENAVNNTLLAMRTSELTGILWHQGENDAVNKNDALTYKTRFLSMITELKKRLGKPDIPVILGELGEFCFKWENGKIKYYKTVNDQLHQITNELDVSAVASSKGLTDRGDGVHFDSASYRELGKRYFDAYLKVVK